MLYDNVVYEYPHSDRVVIIGDIHGDLKRFKNILIDAKIINASIEWIAEPQNTFVVQLGDQVDSLNRNPLVSEWEVLDDTEIVKFTNFLDNLARSKGGRVISLIGNHEFMNTIGNYSYVSSKSLESTERRTELFKPKGSLASLLSCRPIVLKIGTLFFCHAGLKKHHLDVLEKHNRHISYLNIIWKNYILNGQVLQEDKEIFDKVILEYDGILWTREFDDLQTMQSNLHKLGCTFMFVGHTTVESVRCLGGLVWYVDTGISRAYGTTSYQYVDIYDYKINVKQIQE